MGDVNLAHVSLDEWENMQEKLAVEHEIYLEKKVRCADLEAKVARLRNIIRLNRETFQKCLNNLLDSGKEGE